MSLALLTDLSFSGWVQLAIQVPILGLLIALMVLLYKLAPTWKDVKIEDNKIRAAQANAALESARSAGALAEAVKVMSRDHRKVTDTTEEIGLFLRVASQDNRNLTARIERVERALSDQVRTLFEGRKSQEDQERQK